MKRGFSLIETIITIGISVIALLALVNIFLTFNTIYGYQQISLATSGSAGAAMNALEVAVLPAEQVLSSHSFSGTMYTSGPATLVLQLPSVDSSGNIIAGAKDYVVFYSSSAMLYRLTEAASNSTRVPGLQTLSTTLDSISFTYNDGDFTKVTNVIADVQTQAQYKQEIVQGRLTEQLFLRNYSL